MVLAVVYSFHLIRKKCTLYTVVKCGGVQYEKVVIISQLWTESHHVLRKDTRCGFCVVWEGIKKLSYQIKISHPLFS